MKRDCGTTLATMLILICCIGGSVDSGSFVTHRVLIRSVSHHGNTAFIEEELPSKHLMVPTVWSVQLLDGNLLPLADIDELHNLPPPVFV
jgi:hypothetical protein